MTTDLPLLSAAGLRALAAAFEARPAGACDPCDGLLAPGWESLPSTFETTRLRRIGTLRDPAVEAPTLREHHPKGTHGWSPEAPIAPAWYPANRCDVWACAACERPFLRYTEAGGYYVDERIRPVRAALVVDVAAPQD